MKMKIHERIFDYKIEDMLLTIEIFIHEYSNDFYKEFRIFFLGNDVTSFIKTTMKYTYNELEEQVDLKVNEIKKGA